MAGRGARGHGHAVRGPLIGRAYSSNAASCVCCAGAGANFGQSLGVLPNILKPSICTRDTAATEPTQFRHPHQEA
jgi:hypothetical protein